MKEMIEQLAKLRLVPVISLEKAENILPLGKILVENGLPVAEITFRSEAAKEAIKLLREAYPSLLIGAGTVLTPKQVEQAIQAGADFVVSPGLNPNTVKLCQALEMPIIPGVNDPSAVEAALELGLKMLKFFPAEASGGVKMIKALCSVYDIQVMPTGGVSLSNIADYLAIHRVVACGGSWMVESALLNQGKWDEVEKLVKAAVSHLNAL